MTPTVFANRARTASASLAQQDIAPHRTGELLIRFRGGLSESDKATAIASVDARRKRPLRGESRIEKLELASGQNPETAARHLRLNPAIEFAEPNFLINQEQLRHESKAPSFIA